nr:TIM-barrel domain-containing protein [uncultured Mucilaginibacter sp.]
MKLISPYFCFILAVFNWCNASAQQIQVNHQPGRLEIRSVGKGCIRMTLRPVSYKQPFPENPAVVDRDYGKAILSITNVNGPLQRMVGDLKVTVTASPLTVSISNKNGALVQKITMEADGKLSFKLNKGPVFGLGEGGQAPEKGVDWRTLPVQYDRGGRYYKMQPRWQRDAYGSRNPVALLVSPGNWAIFAATPWVEVDLTAADRGVFIPWKPTGKEDQPQTLSNQGLNLGKGLPPIDKIVPGLYDVFVFDAHDPATFIKNFSTITGPAVLPPKWALGYMQSHRTLQDDKQMVGIVDTFRTKEIPVDAVIYLGTGFTPRGWNKQQPSFEFNPAVLKRSPEEVLSALHARNVKVVLHMVPWDRDKLPNLYGNIPVKPGETVDASHIQSYWNEHVPVMKAGADAFWPDEGDWFNLFERIKRHQLYYQGHLSYAPNTRPWSLQRNGYPGIAQWGGWVWSGDTESSWKTLETQIAVGLNYAVSIGPYWGTDIGGFFPNAELTGELYARWFQFGAFNPLFRSHGVTWHTRLPWGWGDGKMGPPEGRVYPLESELNNPAIEPVIKKYDELRYQLLPYNYTLAWQAYKTGLPLMRPMWMHYPNDEKCRSAADQFLWGRDMLIAPVYKKGATSRKVYLPEGEWYDWWTGTKTTGAQTITRNVDLSVLPIYVRAGAIIPMDPVRQYTAQKVDEPTTLKIFTGANGSYTLYNDDGISQDYLKGKGSETVILWNNTEQKITIRAAAAAGKANASSPQKFTINLVPGSKSKTVIFRGKEVSVKM